MIGRRELLRAGAAIAAARLASALGVPLAACARDDALLRALRGFFADRDAARAVGSELLAQDPQHANAPALLQRIAGERGPEWSELAERDPALLASTLRAQLRADFAEGRVVALRGWVLSRTESALLALAALPD